MSYTPEKAAIDYQEPFFFGRHQDMTQDKNVTLRHAQVR
jgi:hypothetical protein